MDWGDWELFCEVVQHGGFSAAGRVIGHPKSSLSAAVQRLHPVPGTYSPLPHPTHQQSRAFGSSQGSSQVIMHPAATPQLAPIGTTEAELVQRARNREEAAVRAIMQSNNRRLYRIARGILRN